MAIRIILADDHPLILDGLENLFRLEKDFEVVARCTDGIRTLEAVRRYRPDVLLLDIRMPGKDGLEIAKEIAAEGIPVRIVLLTAELQEDQLLESLHSGVCGVVLKETAPQLVVQCIRKVHAGEQWIERGVARQALAKMLCRDAANQEIAALLTPREMEIVRMVGRAFHNVEIAEKLCISEGTVKVHLHNIFEKLNVDSRLALMRLVQEKGLV